MKWAQKNKNGFTIVELLIVVVVIGILASIVTVAYSGITQSARDSKRQADMKSIESALELYHLDNGGYPACNNTPYVPGGTSNRVCPMSSLVSSLVPKYMSSIPVDPINSGNDIYRYAVGYKKTTATGFSSDLSDNFITGMKLETVSTVVSGWTSPNYYTYLGGSNN